MTSLRAGAGEGGDSLMELLAACGGEERLRGAFVEGLRDLREEGFGLWSFEGEDEVGAGAELAGAGEDAVDQLLGELLGAFGERAGKEDDGVDARHLEVDGFACVFGGALEVETGVAAAGEADGADAGIADELEAVFVADVVDQLDGGGRESGLIRRLSGLVQRASVSCWGGGDGPWR